MPPSATERPVFLIACRLFRMVYTTRIKESHMNTHTEFSRKASISICTINQFFSIRPTTVGPREYAITDIFFTQFNKHDPYKRMPPRSSRSVVIALLVALSLSTARGAFTTVFNDANAKLPVNIIATGNYLADPRDRTGYTGALSNDALAIVSSMQEAFASLRAQLIQTTAALSEQIYQLAENRAAYATDIMDMIADYNDMRIAQDWDVHQPMQPPINQLLDTGSLQNGFADLHAVQDPIIWDFYDFTEQDTQVGAIHDVPLGLIEWQVPMTDQKISTTDEWNISHFIAWTGPVIADL